MDGLTFTAELLNGLFAGPDAAILGFWHGLAEKAGAVLTPVMKAASLLGEKGIAILLLALALMCFRKTRKMGVCVFGAVCCGALLTNLLIKDAVARPRPFEMTEQFRQWWEFVGAPAEDGYSFPSGHTTAAAAGAMALGLTSRRKGMWACLLFPVAMAASRNYLMVHYPSDVAAGMLIGVVAALIAYAITNLIFRFLRAHKRWGWCRFALQADVRKLLGRRAGTQRTA